MPLLLHRCIADQCRKSLFFEVKEKPHKSLMVFSSWTPGRIFQEKGTCVVFRIAPHRLGLQELKLSTRRICQRILCSQSLYEACEVLVAASPSSAQSVIIRIRSSATTGARKRGFRQLMLRQTAH